MILREEENDYQELKVSSIKSEVKYVACILDSILVTHWVLIIGKRIPSYQAIVDIRFIFRKRLKLKRLSSCQSDQRSNNICHKILNIIAIEYLDIHPYPVS
jgi:hypothetical protein